VTRPTLGSDPEFFIKSRSTGSPTPICGLLGGTKGKPIQTGDYGVQEDNVMAEYNTPPVSDASRFASHVLNGRHTVMKLLDKSHKGQFEVDLAPSRLFPHALLETPQAKTFGCSPDFDAYQMGMPNMRIAPEVLENAQGGWRFSGGHVHIGFREGQKFDIPHYVAAQFADVFIGLYAVSFDEQGERRKHYGTAGRYRPTPYGIEYRTLSNVWTYDASTAETVGHYALQLGNYLSRKEAEVKRMWSEIPWQDVKRAIETEDRALAQNLTSYCQNLGMEI
jgi:hypothetical protein